MANWSPDRQQAVQARCDKATKGPWLLFARGKTISISLEGKFGKTPCVVNWPGFDGCDLPLSKQRANAAFIAASREAVPWLIEIVEAQARVIREMEPFIDRQAGDPIAQSVIKAESALAAKIRKVIP